MVQFVEAVAAEEDGAAQVSDTEMDSSPDPQLLLHSRSPPLLVCGFACQEVTHSRRETGSPLVVFVLCVQSRLSGAFNKAFFKIFFVAFEATLHVNLLGGFPQVSVDSHVSRE